MISSLVFDSKWHWLDGSIVDDSVINWCSNSTYKTTTGAQCAAYDSTLQCVNNYLCNTTLPAPCVFGNHQLTLLLWSFFHFSSKFKI